MMNKKNKEYTLITPEEMTVDMVRAKYGKVSFAYSERTKNANDEYLYTVVAVSKLLSAPILRGYLFLDNISFIGVEKTEFEFIAEGYSPSWVSKF